MEKKENIKTDVELETNFVWDSDSEPTEEVPETKEKKEEKKPKSKAEQYEELRKDLLKKREIFRKEFIDSDRDIDIEIMYMQGMGIPRSYIIRSMDLHDMDKIEIETQELAEQILEDLKQEAKERNIETNDIYLTERDREDIYRNIVVKNCTLYPENFGERIINKNARPGDVAEIYKAVMAFSGFFAPVYEIDDEVNSPQDFLGSKFTSNSSFEDE